MNQKTQAFLTQFAALCDEHGVDFAADQDGAVVFAGGGFEGGDEWSTPHLSIRIGLYSVAEIEDLLRARDSLKEDGR